MGRYYIVAAVLLLLLAGRSLATPAVDDNSIGPKKWKDPIKVYIPPDPAPGRTRQVQVKAAVDSWISKLAGAGTGLDISTVMLDAAGNDPATGMPPPTEGGAVNVSWVDGPLTGEATTGTLGEDSGTTGKGPDGKPISILKNQQSNGGTVMINKGITAFVGVDQNNALKTMMHEFGHILNLDHESKSDSVMQKNLISYQGLTGPGDSDLAEVKSIYIASTGNLTPTVTPVPGGFDYSYTATWVAGGDIPLVQVVTPFADVSDFTTPPGWVIVPPEPGWPLNIVHLRVDPTDALTAYLNADNPSLSFSFFSSMPPGETIGWIGEPVTTIGPVPEPGTMALLVMAAPLACRRRLRRVDG